MLQAFRVSYTPGPLSGPLFADLELTVDAGECVCLIGANGSGKTCLIEILAGIRQPQTGKVVLQSGAQLAYVAQDVGSTASGTLAEALLDDPDEPEHRARIKRQLARLGLPPDRLDDPVRTFSIGERVRAEIARAAANEPNILLLDEPTNHLDIHGKEWLIRFLEGWKGACLMVCHDRAVIDAVAVRTLELERGELKEYAGGFTDARAAKGLAAEQARAEYERNRQEERRLRDVALKSMQKAAALAKPSRNRTYDPKAKPFYEAMSARAAKQAKAIRGRAERVLEQRVEKPFEPDGVRLSFSAKPLRHSDAVSVRGLEKRFGDRELFGGLNLSVCRGERLALLGPNGAGKTTLMRILLKEVAPDAGEVRWSPDAKPIYLTQGRERLKSDQRVVEAIGGDEASVRTLLACLGLRNVAADKLVSSLSVGERTKAELVGLLTSPANVLLLDEPTNHLDVAAMEALEEALLQFPGAILFTSHDMAFVERISTSKVVLSR